MNHTEVGLAGEYYVLAQLAHRGLVGTLTLSNTKAVDILVTNQQIDTLYKVEVKTTRKKPARERVFGDSPQYGWPMSKKHETLHAPNLFYVFVYLRDPEHRPEFFVVPSAEVARYVKWQHEFWLSTRKTPVKSTTMRRFRIPVDDPKGDRENWAVFQGL